jgi:hypothetical protein
MPVCTCELNDVLNYIPGNGWDHTNWSRYWEYLKPQIRAIFEELRNLLLLDLDGLLPQHFRPPCRTNPQVIGSRKHQRLIRRVVSETLQGDIFTASGVDPGEVDVNLRSELRGSLSDINARDLYKGPFRIALTNDPSQHLRFVETRLQPTILVLDSQTICILAILDLTGFMK